MTIDGYPGIEYVRFTAYLYDVQMDACMGNTGGGFLDQQQALLYGFIDKIHSQPDFIALLAVNTQLQ